MPGKEYYNDIEKSELIVAQYLNENGFDWNYETPVFVFDEKKRPRVWTPDFYLPAFQMYVEVCGSKDFDYEYRDKIYKKNDIPVVFLHLYKDKDEWQKWLRIKIVEMEEERHHKVMSYVKKLLLK